MPKTKYPNQIDSPQELPIVRDNIFEIGSDAINSLRSAIIQIEKTLGINPQGDIGQSLNDRISKSLDSSGNLKREAINSLGVLISPVSDDQVSDVAAIKESKLKLDYPTKILGSQVSYLSSLISEISNKVNELSTKLSAHLSKEATNRHAALSISTTSISNVTSSSAIKSLDASNVQSVLENIFSSHINYDGSNISEENSSHKASQVFFDKSNVSNISNSDVQGAIEDLSNVISAGSFEHQDLMHSNGYARSSYIYDPSNLEYGSVISDASVLDISSNDGSKPYFQALLQTQLDIPTLALTVGDIVELTINSVVKEYEIYEVLYNSTLDKIIGFNLFGLQASDYSSVSAKIFLRRYRSYNSLGFLATARQKANLSSSDIVQIINPDSAFIITKELNAEKISSSNRYINIKVDGQEFNFDLYNPHIDKQSIDSVLKSFNEKVDVLNLPILAYRIDFEEGRSEIVISHNISSADVASSSLKVIRVDDSIDSLGLAYLESKVIYGQIGSSYYISGIKHTGLLKKLDSSTLSIAKGSNRIESSASNIDFLSYNLKKGDIVNIYESSFSSYEVEEVTSSYITVNSRQLPTGWSSTIDAVRCIVYENSCLVNSLEFKNVATSVGSSLIDVFMNSERRISINLVAEQESASLSSTSLYSIVDFVNIKKSTSTVLNFETTTDSCVNIWLDDSSSVAKIVGDFNYVWLKSNLNNLECKFYIKNKSDLYNYVSLNGGTASANIFFSEEINTESHIIISRALYSNFLGKFDAGIYGSSFSSKLNFGNLSKKDISTDFKRILTEMPISELRSSGVIFGLKVLSVSDTFEVTISDGTCYVVGKRFDLSFSKTVGSGIDHSLYDKFYIGIDSNGNVVFSTPDSSCSYPWSEENIIPLATIEKHSYGIDIIDQRLFIDQLDLKILNSITVSPQRGMAHFEDLRDAIKYAKRFSELYKKSDIPEIKLKAGTHRVYSELTTTSTYFVWLANISSGTSNEDRTAFYNNLITKGLCLDFPIKIIGEGSSSKVEQVIKVTFANTTLFFSGCISILGSKFDVSNDYTSVSHDNFTTGNIFLSDFSISVGGISLFDVVNQVDSTYYPFKLIFSNLNFEDNSTDSLSASIGSYYSGILFEELSDITNYKGNATITNCSFYNGSVISFEPIGTSSSVRYKHISMIGNGTTNSSGLSNPATSVVASFPVENDITELGTLTISSLAATKTDRIAANLLVGKSLTAEDYNYISTKTLKINVPLKNMLVDDIVWLRVWSSGATIATEGALSLNTPTVVLLNGTWYVSFNVEDSIRYQVIKYIRLNLNIPSSSSPPTSTEFSVELLGSPVRSDLMDSITSLYSVNYTASRFPGFGHRTSSEDISFPYTPTEDIITHVLKISYISGDQYILIQGISFIYETTNVEKSLNII
jgi:hypothetical protein